MSRRNKRHQVLDDIAIANAQLDEAEKAMEKLAFLSQRAMATSPGIAVEAKHHVNEYMKRDLGSVRLRLHQLMGSVRIANEKRERGHRPVRFELER